jgi:hypothetical protein
LLKDESFPTCQLSLRSDQRGIETGIGLSELTDNQPVDFVVDAGHLRLNPLPSIAEGRQIVSQALVTSLLGLSDHLAVNSVRPVWQVRVEPFLSRNRLKLLIGESGSPPRAYDAGLAKSVNGPFNLKQFRLKHLSFLLQGGQISGRYLCLPGTLTRLLQPQLVIQPYLLCGSPTGRNGLVRDTKCPTLHTGLGCSSNGLWQPSRWGRGSNTFSKRKRGLTSSYSRGSFASSQLSRNGPLDCGKLWNVLSSCLCDLCALRLWNP